MGWLKGQVKSGQRQEDTVYRIVLGQLAGTMLGAGVLAAFDGVMGYSFLLGGLASALPSGYMAWRMSRLSANPAMAFRAMIVGEMGKLMITAMLFLVIFTRVTPLSVPLFFTGMALAMAANVVVPLLDSRRAKRSATDS